MLIQLPYSNSNSGETTTTTTNDDHPDKALYPAIDAILLKMPKENLKTLQFILSLLAKVVLEDSNRMDLKNISNIFASALIRPRVQVALKT